jgi:hypothetical protein
LYRRIKPFGCTLIVLLMLWLKSPEKTKNLLAEEVEIKCFI